MYELASNLILSDLNDFKDYYLIWVYNPDNTVHMKLLEMLFTQIGLKGKAVANFKEGLELAENIV